MNQQDFKNTVFILKDKMYRFAGRMLERADEAQDTVQDVLIKLWQMKDELHTVSNIEAFAIRCVKNECLNRMKHAKVVDNYRLQNKDADSFLPKGTDNIKQIILNIINELPEKQKMIIHLKDVEEYKTDEIAGILDIEINAVRVNLMRARQKVRAQLEKIFEYEKQQIRGIEK